MCAAQEQEVTVTEARAIACRYLARREHSCKELADKLGRKGIPRQIIADAIEGLAAEELVSDQRFAEAYARSRVSRLYGPYRIRADLAKRGIEEALAEQVLSSHADDWVESAGHWIKKRAGASELDRETRARLYRSGTNRGFSHEQMMRAFDLVRRGTQLERDPDTPS